MVTFRNDANNPLDLIVHGTDILVTEFHGDISRISDVEPGGNPVVSTFTPGFDKASSFAPDNNGGFFVTK